MREEKTDATLTATNSKVDRLITALSEGPGTSSGGAEGREREAPTGGEWRRTLGQTPAFITGQSDFITHIESFKDFIELNDINQEDKIKRLFLTTLDQKARMRCAGLEPGRTPCLEMSADAYIARLQEQFVPRATLLIERGVSKIPRKGSAGPCLRQKNLKHHQPGWTWARNHRTTHEGPRKARPQLGSRARGADVPGGGRWLVRCRGRGGGGRAGRAADRLCRGPRRSQVHPTGGAGLPHCWRGREQALFPLQKSEPLSPPMPDADEEPLLSYGEDGLSPPAPQRGWRGGARGPQRGRRGSRGSGRAPARGRPAPLSGFPTHLPAPGQTMRPITSAQAGHSRNQDF